MECPSVFNLVSLAGSSVFLANAPCETCVSDPGTNTHERTHRHLAEPDYRCTVRVPYLNPNVLLTRIMSEAGNAHDFHSLVAFMGKSVDGRSERDNVTSAHPATNIYMRCLQFGFNLFGICTFF